MTVLIQPTKRIRPTGIWGRGVTAAQQTFNLRGESSSLSGPTRLLRHSCNSTGRVPAS